MEISGSAYGLHDVEPARLIGIIGSGTDRVCTGSLRIAFHQEPGVFTVARTEAVCELVVKWEVALRLMALAHVLVLQNRLLRGETPELSATPGRPRVFRVTGGLRASPIVCSWDAATSDVELRPDDEGTPDQFELILKEEAAAELVMALAERIALNGTTLTRKGSDPA